MTEVKKFILEISDNNIVIEKKKDEIRGLYNEIEVNKCDFLLFKRKKVSSNISNYSSKDKFDNILPVERKESFKEITKRIREETWKAVMNNIPYSPYYTKEIMKNKFVFRISKFVRKYKTISSSSLRKNMFSGIKRPKGRQWDELLDLAVKKGVLTLKQGGSGGIIVSCIE